MKNKIAFDNLHCILQDLIISFLKNNHIEFPVLLLSKKLLKKNIEFFMENIIVDKIYFPVKTNNLLDVLNFLKSEGVYFEIASLGELQLLKTIDVPSENIIFGNPIKIKQHIDISAQNGVNTFAIDTESELIKISHYIQNANIYLRLDVSNNGAEWELSEKFGCDIENAVNLFKKAIELKMNPVGISFHIGWNNSNTLTWEQAIMKSYWVIEKCKAANITLKFINIGGGFPAHLINDQYDTLNEIARIINPYLKKIKIEFGMEVYAEPGSFLTTNTGIVISKVINVIKRKDRIWAYLDTGINQGFTWIMGGLEYAIFSPYKMVSPLTDYVVCGPTCDSHDLFSKQAFLSSELKENDLLLIYPAGSYISSSKMYNGFDYPITKVI